MKTKNQIIRATQKSLEIYGSKLTTIKQISRVANVNQGLIHYYFGCKENLFVEVLDYTDEELLKNIVKINSQENSKIEIDRAIRPHLTVLIELANMSSNMPALLNRLKHRLDVNRITVGNHFGIKDSFNQKLLISAILGLIIHGKIDNDLDIEKAINILVDVLKSS